jgi:hypothetical protein
LAWFQTWIAVFDQIADLSGTMTPRETPDLCQPALLGKVELLAKKNFDPE